MEEYLPRHMSMNHRDDAIDTENDADQSDANGLDVDEETKIKDEDNKSVKNEKIEEEADDLNKERNVSGKAIIMRSCPVCHVEMRAESVVKHCKTKHKVSYNYCNTCSTYILKKVFRMHCKTHKTDDKKDNSAASAHNAIEMTEDDDDTTDNDETDDSKKVMKKNKVFNCKQCNKLFLAQELYENHVKENHPNVEDDGSNNNDADDESDDKKNSGLNIPSEL